MDEKRCVNCGGPVTDKPIDRKPEEKSTIHQGVALKQEPSNDLICHNCQIIVTYSLEPQQTDEALSKNSCINCGKPLLQIRSHLLKTNTKRENLIKNIIIEWIAPQEVSPSSRICHPCWQKADRASVQRTTAPTKESEIILPNYTRAGNSERRCIFPKCQATERIHVPTSIRVRLLCDLSYYVPPKCRICRFHLRSRMWNSLITRKANRAFTADLIEDLLSLLKNQIGNNIDFENIEDSDEELVFYWLGISKDQFRQVLEEVPRLKNSHRGATGLAACLTKFRTGVSDQQLSVLFKLPRSTLVRLMSKAREVLSQDSVGQHLGLQSVITDMNIIAD
ncbi:unnamed protein product [Leptosia nina]|uniref:Uncharacterized protein n=1 Tax=Leptosia nina TaxID=320188 RepID=A0AAV1K674_9NEOP